MIAEEIIPYPAASLYSGEPTVKPSGVGTEIVSIKVVLTAERTNSRMVEKNLEFTSPVIDVKVAIIVFQDTYP